MSTASPQQLKTASTSDGKKGGEEDTKKKDEEEYTFAPKINPYKGKKTETGMDRHKDLYAQAMTSIQKLNEKRATFKDENCTFKPRMSTGNSTFAKKIAKEAVGDGKKRFEKLYAYNEKYRKNVEEMRKQPVASFTPTITSKSKTIAKSRPSLLARPGDKTFYAEKEKNREKLRMERELKGCTFTPTLNRKKGGDDKVSFMERLSKTNAAKEARLKMLKEEKEARIEKSMKHQLKSGKKMANFDRLYKTGTRAERLKKAQEAKEEQLRKIQSAAKSTRRSKSSSNRAPIYERLHQQAAKRSAQRKAMKAKQEEEEMKRLKASAVGGGRTKTGSTSVFDRLESDAQRARERRKMLQKKKAEAEKRRAKKKTTSSSGTSVFDRLEDDARRLREKKKELIEKKKLEEKKATMKKSLDAKARGNGKPYWERFYARKDMKPAHPSTPTEERIFKKHCMSKPKLNSRSKEMASDRSKGETIWNRLNKYDRRAIERKREEERRQLELNACKPRVTKKNNTTTSSSSSSVFDRLASAQKKMTTTSIVSPPTAPSPSTTTTTTTTSIVSPPSAPSPSTTTTTTSAKSADEFEAF